MNSSVFRKKWLPYLFVFIFALCSSLALFMNGDDYLWYYSVEDSSLDAWRTPNGRLFSNQVTIWLVRNIPFRIIFITLTFAAFLVIMGRLFDFKDHIKGNKYYFPLLLLIFIPHTTYAETINWISGYTNYVFSVLMTFVYLLFMFRCFFTEYTAKRIWAVPVFLIGLTGGLCVEHMTIYNVMLAVTLIVIAVKIKKRTVLHAVSFFVGAAVSCFLMFGRGIYGDIYSKGDEVGNRYFELGFSNILQNAYSFIVVHYTKDFWAIPIIITAAFTVLLFRKDLSGSKHKYLMPCITVCWLYSVYSIYTGCISNLRVFTPAMRIVALETAFSFIYVVSLAYLIYVFLDKNSRIRAYIYLVSTFMLTAPFLFISPATARCFFSNYMFWILLCGEVVTCAASTIDWKYGRIAGGFMFTCVFAAAFLILTACFTNKYIDALRFDYIQEQLSEKNNKKLELIDIPYTEYNHDDLEDGLINDTHMVGDFTYGQYIMKYHNIVYDKNITYVELQVSPYDYYIKQIS